MTTELSFTSVDQLDAEGNVIDKIFTIKEVETIVYEKEKTLSGTEVAAKILDLEEKKKTLKAKVDEVVAEINFLKTLV